MRVLDDENNITCIFLTRNIIIIDIDSGQREVDFGYVSKSRWEKAQRTISRRAHNSQNTTIYKNVPPRLFTMSSPPQSIPCPTMERQAPPPKRITLLDAIACQQRCDVLSATRLHVHPVQPLDPEVRRAQLLAILDEAIDYMDDILDEDWPAEGRVENHASVQ